MPLESGKSEAAFSHNVAAEKNAGKPTKQAVAIAYSKQRGDCDLAPDSEDCSLDADPSEVEIEAAIEAGERELKHQQKALSTLKAHDRMPLELAARAAHDRALHEIDLDKHLHIHDANISKAMVCPYLGSEIPEHQALSLDPSRTYMLYRDSAELQAAAPTYENKPLMADHVAVSADNPQKHYIVGSVSNVRFSHPYLKADVTVWDGEAIKRIQDGSQAEISCGYRYTCDMSPGTTPEGEKYDGVMRNLGCNHVALVSAGRCGSDVTASEG